MQRTLRQSVCSESVEAELKPCCAAGVAPVDLLLLMAASENDAPKVAELLRAGAKLDSKVGCTCFCFYIFCCPVV